MSPLKRRFPVTPAAAVLRGAVVTVLLFASHAAAAKKFELMEATVADVHAAYQAHELTSRQLVQMYLDRIKAYDHNGPAIDCIVTVNPKALEEADKEFTTILASR